MREQTPEYALNTIANAPYNDDIALLLVDQEDLFESMSPSDSECHDPFVNTYRALVNKKIKYYRNEDNLLYNALESVPGTPLETYEKRLEEAVPIIINSLTVDMGDFSVSMYD